MGILLDIFNTRFSSFKGSYKTAFRKAVSHIEELLYKEKVTQQQHADK